MFILEGSTVLPNAEPHSGQIAQWQIYIGVFVWLINTTLILITDYRLPQTLLMCALQFVSDKRLVGKPFLIEGKHIFCGDQVSLSQLMHNVILLKLFKW